MTGPGHDVDQRLDIGFGGVGMDDAGPQREPPVEHGLGDKHLAFGLHRLHDPLVQVIECGAIGWGGR